MKLVNNAISLSNLVIAAEAMLVGIPAGIDPHMPIQSVRSVLESFRLAKQELGGEADVTEVVRPLERLAGILLRDSPAAERVAPAREPS
jgi:hypothetical protein